MSIKFPGDRFWDSHNELHGYFQVPLIRPGNTVLDLGAFPGDFSVVASRMVGSKGRIYAFEPEPSNREYLSQLLSANKIRNVEVMDYAVSNKSGYGRISSEGPGSNLLRSEGTLVSTITIDELMKTLGKADVIKTDIEGSEIEAVRGASDTISMPAWVIAIM
jgi:FkbM family methyltransferase